MAAMGVKRSNERTKGTLMIDHDNLETLRDPQTYDLEDEGYYEDYPLTEQWARSLGGPLLDLACGTGRMALRMAAQGYQVPQTTLCNEHPKITLLKMSNV